MVKSINSVSKKPIAQILTHHLRPPSHLLHSKSLGQNEEKSLSLSCHWETVPPRPIQLRKAAEFFQCSKAKFMWSIENFRDMPFGADFGESPEVCFLGRSNVGKSSLLNALLCQRIAFTSSKPGRTKLMSAFTVESTMIADKKDRFIILDVPGYGKGGRADIGHQVIRYLEKRRQLKRVFLLIDSEHGVKNSDMQMLDLCKHIGVPFQVLLSKVDKVIPPSKIIEEISNSSRLGEVIDQVKQTIGTETAEVGLATGEIIPFSSTKWLFGRRLGMNEVRFAVLRAVGLEYQDIRRKLNPSDIITYDQLFPSETNGVD